LAGKELEERDEEVDAWIWIGLKPAESSQPNVQFVFDFHI
jgi:hypothetical protein